MHSQEDFDDDTLLLGGEDDLLGTDEAPEPQETAADGNEKPAETPESEVTKSPPAAEKPEAEPESGTLTEEPTSESDDDGGDVQVSVFDCSSAHVFSSESITISS